MTYVHAMTIQSMMYINTINFDRVMLKSKYHIIHIINNNFNKFSIIDMMLLN